MLSVSMRYIRFVNSQQRVPRFCVSILPRRIFSSISDIHGNNSLHFLSYPTLAAVTNGIKIAATHYAASAFFNSLRGLFMSR